MDGKRNNPRATASEARRKVQDRRRQKLGQALGERSRMPPDPETAAKLLFNETSVLDLINTGVVDDSVDLTAALQAGPALLQRAIGPERAALGVDLARKKITRKEDKLGLKRARQASQGRAEVLVNPVTMHTAAVKFDPAPAKNVPPLPAAHLRGSASKELLAERAAARGGKGATRGNNPGRGSRVNLLEDVAASEPQVLMGPLYAEDEGPPAAAADDAAAEEEEEERRQMEKKKKHAAGADGGVEEGLSVAIGKIRNYLELLDQYSLHHFLVYRGKTLRTTPEFMSFKRKYAPQWADVATLIDQLEQLLTRHKVPLAVVDGGQLADVAIASLDGVSREDMVACIENQDQVLPLLSLPGQGQPRGATKRERQVSAATTIQALGRLYIAKTAYRVRIACERAARAIQTTARAIQATERVQGLLRTERAAAAEAWEGLQATLKRQWATAAAVNAASDSSGGGGGGGGAEQGQAGGRRLFPPLRRRVEVHVPSLSVEEHQRLVMEHFPLEQNFALSRLSALQDPHLEHLIYVTPRELPPEVVEYWMKVLELGGVRDPASRVTFIVPESADIFPLHFPLASLVLYSPATVRRLRKLCARFDQRLLVPGVAGWQEKVLAVKLATPLLAPEPAAAQLYRSHSGAKVAFAKAGVNVAIGAHDIYDQEDLVIALTKLIASNLDIEDWVLKTDGDYDNGGTAVLHVSNFRTVHDLRGERAELTRLQEKEGGGGGNSIWMSPDVQLLARAKLLKDLKVNLPNEVTFVTPRAFGDWPSFLRHFLRVGGVVEAEPPKRCLAGRVAANLLLAPTGAVDVCSCQDVILGATRHVIGAAHPQRTVPAQALETAARAVGAQLAARGVVGYVTTSFVVFRDKGSGGLRMWGEGLEVHLTPSAVAHWTVSLVAGGGGGGGEGGQMSLADSHSMSGSLSGSLFSSTTGSTTTGGSSSSSSSTSSSSSVAYVTSASVFHPKLPEMLFSSFFKLCRLQGISFDLRNKAGVVFNIYDSMACGVMGLLTIGPSAPAATRIAHKVMQFMKKHIGSRTAAGAAAIARGEDDGYSGFLELDDAIKERIKQMA